MVFPQTFRDWRVATGAVSLLATLVAVVVIPPGWIPILLAVVATYGLAASPRLGWLGAGLLVLVAIPYGRGADVAPLQVAGLPVRPQDGVIAAALFGALGSGGLRLRSANPFIIVIGAWLLIGVVALAVGLINGFQLRDVLRDARWWGLYATGAIAIVCATRRDQVVRGLLYGATVLATLVALATVLPAFEGGLKAAVLSYDRGTLRMQFGNSVILVVATAFVALHALRRPSIRRLGWLALLLVAQVLSLTRISLISTGVVVALVAIAYVWERRSSGQLAHAARPLAAVGVTAIVAFAGGIGLNTLGVLTASPDVTGGGENPLDRITFSDEQSDISSIVNSVGSGGRLATYVNTLVEIQKSPVVGRGMGALIEVPFAYNLDRAYTVGKQPGVDNAYLTAALKGGLIAAAALVTVFLVPLLAALHNPTLRAWYVPAWVGLLALTMTQSFAVSSYGPFALALLASLPFLGYAARRAEAARSHAN